MHKLTKRTVQLGHAQPSSSIIDNFMVPLLACAYATIISQLLIYTSSGLPTSLQEIMVVRQENRIFWPALALVALVLLVSHRSRLRGFILPAHLFWLLAYLGLAGASIVWAFKPEFTIVRFLQQLMVVTCIVPIALLAARPCDLMRGLFLCLACGVALNLLFLSDPPPILARNATPGYLGYFTGKNLLGQLAAIAIFLSVHELRYPGARRIAGALIAGLAATLLFLSNSKTSMGLVLLIPILAGSMVLARRYFNISPAILLLAVPVFYILLTTTTGVTAGRFSYALYGDSSFTGRTIILDFARFEIARRPLLGWGYQSFWLVGSDGPSVLEAPGWVKTMPNAHSGYLDAMLELGYVGFAVLVAFIVSTVHAIGRVADTDPARAWLMFSLALLVIITNFLESTWFRGFDMLWVLFLIIAAEAARCLRYARQDALAIGGAPASGRGRSRLARSRPGAEPEARKPAGAVM